MLFMLILVVGNVIINISLIKEYYLKQAKNRMRTTSDEIRRVYHENKVSLEDYIEMIDGTWGIWVRIADEDYNIYYNSNPERSESLKLSKWATKVIEEGKSQIESNGIYYSIITKDDDNIVRLFCITELHDKEGDRYVILSRSIKSVYENIDTANRVVEVTALFVSVIGAVLIFYFSKSITKPLLEINEHAKEISKLNFGKKLNIKTNNEIGTLAESINEISDKLSLSIDDLKKDVDDKRALVRNMSHELKTPISAIKGYSEGLKYAVADTPEKMNKYCDVIIAECNKMDYLVKQMLELSKMERGDWSIDRNTFPANQLIEGIEMCFAEQIKKQKINFTIVNEENFNIYGDYNLLERGAFNFIENAMRYTKQGGLVKVTLERKDKGFTFKVYNEGSFIPEDEMENIWKVYYKTDQSRMRESNNFGVGLSIVKANIGLHGGSVGVENKDDGVEFSFWIPE